MYLHSQMQLGASVKINIKYLLYVSRSTQVEMQLGLRTASQLAQKPSEGAGPRC